MIPTSAVTSPLYHRVTEATLRRGAQYLLLLLIKIWLEHGAQQTADDADDTRTV